MDPLSGRPVRGLADGGEQVGQVGRVDRREQWCPDDVVGGVPEQDCDVGTDVGDSPVAVDVADGQAGPDHGLRRIDAGRVQHSWNGQDQQQQATGAVVERAHDQVGREGLAISPTDAGPGPVPVDAAPEQVHRRVVERRGCDDLVQRAVQQLSPVDPRRSPLPCR